MKKPMTTEEKEAFFHRMYRYCHNLSVYNKIRQETGIDNVYIHDLAMFTSGIIVIGLVNFCKEEKLVVQESATKKFTGKNNVIVNFMNTFNEARNCLAHFPKRLGEKRTLDISPLAFEKQSKDVLDAITNELCLKVSPDMTFEQYYKQLRWANGLDNILKKLCQ